MKAASGTPFPYASRRVCYFRLFDGLPVQVSGKVELRAAVNNGEQLFAAWPGEWRTDLFVIDDPAELLDAIGGAS